MIDMDVTELEYIQIKRLCLEMQRAHYMLLHSYGCNEEKKKALIHTLYDLLDVYSAKIALYPNEAQIVDVPAIFSKQGLSVEKYVK